MNEIWSRSEDAIWVETADAVVVLCVSSAQNQPRALQGGAIDIWLAIEEGKSAHQISEEIAAGYGVERESVQSSVLRFLDILADQGLVTCRRLAQSRG
jgi:hypothetical protein